MSNLENFARHELELAGMFSKESDYDGMLGEAVMKMIRVFDEEGHSGFSANMAISLFERVARFEPLTPLTGADDEWTAIGEQNGLPLFQNKRCPHIFKEGENAYNMQGKVFREPSGACFTNRESFVPVTFPYVPKTEYVDVEAS